MSERVLPGTSIREITEGLIGVPSVGSVAAKLVGTACKGSDEPQFFGPGELSRFLEEYGPADPYQYNTTTYVAGTSPYGELSLVRAGKLLFGVAPPGGVWVCRALASAVKAIGAGCLSTASDSVFEFSAVEYGAWFNNFNFKFQVDYDAEGNSMTTAATKRLSTFWLQIPSLEQFDSAITSGVYSVNQFYQDTVGIAFEFSSITANTSATGGDFVSAWTAATNPLNSYFTLANTGTEAGVLPNDQTTYTSLLTSGDTAGTNWSANDQAAATTTIMAEGLEQMRAKDARLVIIGGHNTGNIAVGQSHVGSVSRAKREQMFICGVENEASQATMVDNILTASEYNLVDARVVIVAPGIQQANPYKDSAISWEVSVINTDDNIVPSGGYAAAMVAGIIANNVPNESPMNKGLVGISGLEFDFTRANQKRLVRDDFFLLVDDNGFRTLDDRTNAGEGDPFQQISTRMALDDIKYALRAAARPWIGKKNVPRNRAGLRKNLEFVVSEYERREIVNSDWLLDIQSSRTEQIIGVVRGTLIIKLVFYIKFIENFSNY